MSDKKDEIENEEVTAEEKSNNEENNTAIGQEAQSEDGSGEKENNDEEEVEDGSNKNYSVDYIVEEMYEAILDELMNNDNPIKSDIYTVEYRILDNQFKNIVAEFIVNEKIAFRQIIDTVNFSVEENRERAIGTLKRNLVAYEKLSKEYLEKHNQEIMFMNQAEVTSIKQLEVVEKSGKTKK